MNPTRPQATSRSAGAAATPSTAALSLLALGVVYGDIGTSPLYAAKETFNPQHGIPLTPDNILGGVSAIFWALMIVVSLKYVVLVLRADNRGEGGIMALLALTASAVRDRPRLLAVVLPVGVFGAALFYGDAVLTPAISVLSAVEGLEVGTSALKPYVVPIAAGVLVALFAIQRHGTGVVGLFFGPVCVAWFAALGTVGAWNIAQAPQILGALDPRHAFAFATSHGVASFIVLGSVLLAITGAEALYADLGHFGKRAIRVAWFGVAAPALLLNYFGQGALLIARPEAIENPFYLAFPAWALYPMVVLATAATVIASQATISGAFSITQQAMQLGYLPRMAMRHTSASTIGQIYVPGLNWLLLLVVGAAVVGFGSSSKLASAYGVAVMGTMLATTFLTYFVLRYRWRYPAWLAIAATGAFMAVDATFFAAAMQKVLDGGWFPLAVGAAMFIVMTTWRRGRELLLERLRGGSPPLRAFVESLLASPPDRVPGNGGVPDLEPGRDAQRAPAQPQALQGAARAQRLPARRVPAGASSRGREARRVRAARRRVLARPRALRFHRGSRRAGRARTLRPRRPRRRADGGHLLPVPRERSSRAQRQAAWPRGATGCSSRWRGTPAASPTSSGCRRTASSSWERGSRSRRAGTAKNPARPRSG